MKKAGQGDGGPDRVHHAALLQPYLAPAFEIGGNSGERQRQLGHLAVDEMTAKELDQLFALDEAAAQGEVEETDHGLQAQAAHPLVQALEVAVHVGGADQRADRGAADDVRIDAGAVQGLNDPDVRPAARRAAAQGQADLFAMRFFHVFCPMPREAAVQSLALEIVMSAISGGAKRRMGGPQVPAPRLT